MPRPSVLLALAEDSDAHREALTAAGFDVVDEFGDHAPAVDLAVLDCDLPFELAEATYRTLHADPGAVPTILLFGDEIPEFATSQTNGHDEFAVKPIPADGLVYRAQALLIRGGKQVPADAGPWAGRSDGGAAAIGEGQVISVFAPKGGVGKTTIAVNMAVALRDQTRSRVLLLDADVGVGNVTSVLAAPYRMGLADLADSPPEEWTDAAFEQVTTEHADTGLQVLTWGTDPGESERIGVDLLLAALRWAKMHHSYVVIDNHPGYDDRTMAMLTMSNEIFLVVTPEVGPLRNSSQFLDLAREVGLGETVKVIVNRANHGIRLADIEQALKLPVSATIVSNGPKAVIASNEGAPVVRRFPKDRLATDLHGVARLVTSNGDGAEAKQPARRSWLSALVSRTSGA